MAYIEIAFVAYVIMNALVLVFCCILAFRRLRTKQEGSNLIKPDREGWYDSMETPAPGSLIVCEGHSHKLYFGYVVAGNGYPALLQIPNYISEYRKPPMEIKCETQNPIHIRLFDRWQYIERRILPVETLGTYEQQYKRTATTNH